MAEVDYGNDIDCVSDLTFTMREVSGAEMMAQSMARRLQVTRGELFYAPEYGFNLLQLVSGIAPPERSLNGSIENELLKDDRVEDVEADAVFDSLAETLTVHVVGIGAFGPFDLTISISNLTVELLREGAAT